MSSSGDPVEGEKLLRRLFGLDDASPSFELPTKKE
jgi:hypothetical protein